NEVQEITGGMRGNAGWSIIIISVPILFYALVCEIVLHGQTLGKKIVDIRVMNLSGGEPSLSQYIIRWIFRFFEWPLVFGVVFPGFFILYQLFGMILPGIVVIIIIAVTQKHQRLGDLAANTVIVKTRINTSINDTIFQDVDEKNYQVVFAEVMKLSDRDINTIKSVITNSHTKSGRDLAHRTADRVKTALKIQTDAEDVPFLEHLLQDYNYLATKE
ncbi:MAG TPA: RDD family protein, partial [Chitinophagaceae bacterium]|nr:RDD family protein [Chitinophagaceae bacterium]